MTITRRVGFALFIVAALAAGTAFALLPRGARADGFLWRSLLFEAVALPPKGAVDPDFGGPIADAGQPTPATGDAELAQRVLVHADPRMYFWQWTRDLMEVAQLPDVAARYKADPSLYQGMYPGTPAPEGRQAEWRAAQQRQEAIREGLFAKMANEAQKLDPDNGWSDLLAAMLDAHRGIGYFDVYLPDPDSPDGRKAASRAVAVTPEHSAAAARRLHEAVRKPAFTQYMDPLCRRWLTRAGPLNTYLRAMRMSMGQGSVLLPQLSQVRQLARLMAGEGERRAPPLVPPEYLPDPEAADEPPRPVYNPKQPFTPEERAQEQAWQAWQVRRINHPNVIVPPPPGPPPSTTDDLTAYDVFHDVQTLGARIVANGDMLVELLVGYAVINLGSLEGERILTAAGRAEEAERLVARGRHLSWPLLLAGLTNHLRAQKMGEKSNARPFERSLYQDPALWVEAERLAMMPTDSVWEDDAFWRSGRAGILPADLLPALNRATPRNEIVVAREDFVPYRRFEYYGTLKNGVLPYVVGAWTALLALLALAAALALSAGWAFRPDVSAPPARRSAAKVFLFLVASVAITALFAWSILAGFDLSLADAHRAMDLWFWGFLASGWVLGLAVCRLVAILVQGRRSGGDPETPASEAPADVPTVGFSRVALCGAGAFALAWLVATLATELPGTPTHEANGATPLALIQWESIYADLGVEEKPFSFTVLLHPSFHWLGFWYGWALLAGVWFLLARAGSGLPGNRRLAKSVGAGLGAAAAAFLLYYYLYQDEIAQRLTRFGSDDQLFFWMLSRNEGLTDIPEWCLIPALLWGAGLVLTAWHASRVFSRTERPRRAGAVRLVLGGLACGVLLWIVAARVWPGIWERRWSAADTVMLPRPDDPNPASMTALEGRVIGWHRREAARRLAEEP